MSRKLFQLLHVSQKRKIKGFTLVEVLVVAFILSVITGGFFYAMNAGRLSFNLSLARGNLQSEVRRNIDWIIKDVRQTASSELAKADNNPSPNHIKFKQVMGWDPTSNPPSFLWGDYYIEYTYDAANSTIVRTTNDPKHPNGPWTFYNITTSPFFTRNSSGDIVALNDRDLGTSKQLIIKIFGQAQVWGGHNTTYSLTEEVQIRNNV